MTSKNILDLNNRLYQTSYVGFDRLFDEFFKLQSSTKNVPNYPPYNLVKDGDSYTIEMAMAGLTDKDVDVVLEDRTLTISYEKSEEDIDEVKVVSPTKEIAVLMSSFLNWTKILEG